VRVIQPYAKWAVLLALVFLLAYEAFAVFNHKPGDSISAVVWNAVQSSLMIPFLGGVLCGHLFFNNGLKPAVAFLLGLLGGGFAWRASSGPHA
jgi:hypothetical protein